MDMCRSVKSDVVFLSRDANKLFTPNGIFHGFLVDALHYCGVAFNHLVRRKLSCNKTTTTV